MGSMFISSGEQYLVTIDYEAYGQKQREYIMTNEVLLTYIYKRRLRRGCDTGLIYNITHYLLNKVVVEEFMHKNIVGKRKGRMEIQVMNKRISKKVL